MPNRWKMIALLIFGISVALLSSFVPNKWDRSVAIGTCGGLPILQQENGSLWLRVSSVRVYRVENLEKLTCK
jgi:hypothetical protein